MTATIVVLLCIASFLFGFVVRSMLNDGEPDLEPEDNTYLRKIPGGWAVGYEHPLERGFLASHEVLETRPPYSISGSVKKCRCDTGVGASGPCRESFGFDSYCGPCCCTCHRAEEPRELGYQDEER